MGAPSAAWSIPVFHVKTPITPQRFHLRLFLLNVVLLSLPCLSTCSTQQAYGVGQAWQRNECHKIIDTQEHARCVASTSMSYDEYKRRTEAAKDPK
jgi:hypothetical protein